MFKTLAAIAVAAATLTACTTHVARSAGDPQQLKGTEMTAKETVGAFLGAVARGDADTMRELANPDYIQHNPFIPTGLDAFIELLPALQEAGTTAENI
ncbi:MAG: hypothetical protein ACO33A_14505, partial [Hyphomonas sp.]